MLTFATNLKMLLPVGLAQMHKLEKVAAASPFFRASAVLIELPQSLA